MKIVYNRALLKDVKKITKKKLQQKIEDAIIEMKNVPNLNDLKGLKRLKGHPFAYRIRIGDYRLGFYFDNNTIELIRFLKRNDIYKVFP